MAELYSLDVGARSKPAERLARDSLHLRALRDDHPDVIPSEFGDSRK
jgi:hypothetical protein